MADRPSQTPLTMVTQLAYGVGDLGPSMAGNTLNVFFFFFLTSIAAIPADRAGLVLMVSNIWSAVSTLLVGTLSDRTQSRWGRRRIWMLGSAPILALSFGLHWWVPPLQEWGAFGYYVAMAILFQTAGSAFFIPYGAFVPDLTDNPHEQIRLNGIRFGFSLGGCIGSLVLAQGLDHWLHQPQRQLFNLGWICACMIVVSITCCCIGTFESSNPPSVHPSSSNAWRSLFRNYPLLLLVGIYSLAWLATQITPALLPYFMVNYLGLGTDAIAPIVLLIQAIALGSLFIWEPLSRRLGTAIVFWAGASLWMLSELMLFYLHADQMLWVYGSAIGIGLGMAVAYLVPSSMLPEVIDLDEKLTAQRREGMIYSLLVFLQKVTLAIGFFIVGQLLSWSGFQEAVPGPLQLLQPDSALLTIRLIVIALPTLALVGSLLLIGIYPFAHQRALGDVSQRST